jgi:putative colanic acid biosynthesis acetyltransferase WcaF
MTSSYISEKKSFSDYLELALWRIVGQPVFNLIPLPFFSLRVFILRIFGAKIGPNNRLNPSIRIWLPRNLRLGTCVGIGDNVYLYNKSMIDIEDGCVISRSSFLCTASHDYNSKHFELFSAPIFIKPYTWIAANAIILPGLVLAEGSVIGAGAVLSKNTEPWSVYAGNPAYLVKKRKIFGRD